MRLYIETFGYHVTVDRGFAHVRLCMKLSNLALSSSFKMIIHKKAHVVDVCLLILFILRPSFSSLFFPPFLLFLVSFLPLLPFLSGVQLFFFLPFLPLFFCLLFFSCFVCF